jgi:hypothetical protein
MDHLLVLPDQRLKGRMVAVSALRYPMLIFVRIGHAVLMLTDDKTMENEQSFEFSAKYFPRFERTARRIC